MERGGEANGLTANAAQASREPRLREVAGSSLWARRRGWGTPGYAPPKFLLRAVNTTKKERRALPLLLKKIFTSAKRLMKGGVGKVLARGFTAGKGKVFWRDLCTIAHTLFSKNDPGPGPP